MSNLFWFACQNQPKYLTKLFCVPTKIFKIILLDVVMGIHLKPWITGINSAEQRKYISTFGFLLQQAHNKHRFESPNITRLARLLFPECWLVAHRTIVGDNGYTIYCRPILIIKRVRLTDASNPPSVFRQYCCGIVVSSQKFRMMSVPQLCWVLLRVAKTVPSHNGLYSHPMREILLSQQYFIGN